MNELESAIIENLSTELQSVRTYQINKSRMITLTQAYCTYKMPKKDQITFKRYKSTCWLSFFNQENQLVDITLDKMYGKYYFRICCKEDEVDEIKKFGDEIMKQYFNEKKMIPNVGRMKR